MNSDKKSCRSFCLQVPKVLDMISVLSNFLTGEFFSVLLVFPQGENLQALLNNP